MKDTVIVFTKKLYQHTDYDTIPFDEGMKAKVIGDIKPGRIKGTLVLDLDMSDFIEHNISRMKHNWENHSGDNVIPWCRTQFYPRDHITKIIIHDTHKPYRIL